MRTRSLIPFKSPLQEAVFLARPNRFVAVIRLPGAPEPVLAHVADPGRLRELLVPEASLYVRDHGNSPTRKLRYTVALVRSAEGHWVSIHSGLPNRLVGHLLSAGTLPGLEQAKLVRREYTYRSPSGGKSRFDFLLELPRKRRCLVEVKGASLVEDGWCKFPDAPTVRGARHVRELIEARKDGYEARVIFVVQRHDPHSLMPHHLRDPVFTQALRDAVSAGVGAHAFCFQMSPQGCLYTREIPVVLP
jgi:sugar fermentation stimulation protein A